MINFEEEIKKFEPSLEVSKLEDAIIQSEMSDFNDIIMGILKKQKDSDAEEISKAELQNHFAVQAPEIDLDKTEYPEGEYLDEVPQEERYIPPEYEIKHDE